MLHRATPCPLVPVFELRPGVLDAKETRALRNAFSDQIFLDTRDKLGLETALDRLAPSFGRRRRPGHRARAARRLAWEIVDVVLVVAVVVVTAVAAAVLVPLTLITIAPLLYELGV